MESEDNQLPRMDYVDFEVEIDHLEGRDYLVKVVQSKLSGEATETMHFPFGQQELASHLDHLKIALLQSGGKRRSFPTAQEETVQNFGKTLFDALFTGKVSNRYAAAKNRIAEPGIGLRLKLRINAPELAALPWEFLYDQDAGDYICLSSNTPIVRYLEAPIPPQPLSVAPPLSILAMTAAPKDLVGLDIEQEKQRLEQAVEELRLSNKVKLKWLEGHKASDLQNAMRQGPWHIFHFIGHGGFSTETDEGLIALENNLGFAHYFSAKKLARLLRDHFYLRLVVLNSCEGAVGSPQDLFSSTAATLVRSGIPAVLAMQYDITDLAALILSHVFYEVLAEGKSVDTALGEARKAISIEIENTLEWGTPVLYTRSPDGVLFAVKPQSDVELQARKAEEERVRKVKEAEERARKVKEEEQLRLAEEERARTAKEAEERARQAKEKEQLRLAEEARIRKAKEKPVRKSIDSSRAQPRQMAPQLPPITPDSTKVMLHVSTIGQIDHGKTTLTAAITRVLNKENKANNYVTFDQIDKAPEERYFGMSIASSQVEYKSGSRQYYHTDCPGHADYVKRMIAGPDQIDAAILVVSAPDGPMPQTREQIRLAGQVGIPAIVVFLNKLDIMDDEELLELIELEVRELLNQFGFPGDDVPVIRGSAIQALQSRGSLSRGDSSAVCIWNLIDAMNAYIPMPTRASDKPFLMSIDDVFNIKGRDTIGTGRIEQGSIKVGDRVDIVGMQNTSRTAVVTGVEMSQKALDKGTVGDNIGCLLRGIERADLVRGQVLASPGSIRAYKAFKAEVYLMTTQEGGRQAPFFNAYRPQFYIRTTDVTGAIQLPDGVEMVMPGDSIELTVELIQPVAMKEGVKFAIREGGRTVGAGICTGIVN